MDQFLCYIAIPALFLAILIAFQKKDPDFSWGILLKPVGLAFVVMVGIPVAIKVIALAVVSLFK